MATARHYLGNVLLVLIALVIGAVLAEGAAQLYAYKVVKLGKLFRPDDQLGWALLPNSTRSGTITTASPGLRAPATRAFAAPRTGRRRPRGGC